MGEGLGMRVKIIETNPMTKFPEYDSFDGLGLAHLVQTHVVSPEELLDAAIERIEKINPQINAVIYKMYDEARAAIKHKPSGLFQGVPFLLKDLIAEYQGAPLSMGSRFVKGLLSTQDSELVKRYKKAGLIILGKTNVPEFGLGSVTEPELYGPTCNPWNVSRAAGGSSGGSAAAVATRMVPMAHGNDGGGSLRIPSAYCGVFGFKPTRGLTPVGPQVMRVALGMVTEHVITRSVRDSAAMLDISVGLELGSPISLPAPQKSFLQSLHEAPKKLKIAISEQPFFVGKLAPEYAAFLKRAGELCQRLGHIVEPANFSVNHDEVLKAFLIIFIAEVNAQLKALSKLMHKKINLAELEKKTALAYAAAEVFSASDYAWAVHTADKVSRQAAEFFKRHDVLLTPTMGLPAPPLGFFKLTTMQETILDILRFLPNGPWLRSAAKAAGKKIFSMVPYTPLANFVGLPAMSVPLYWDKEGMPVGIQFTGCLGDDVRLLQLAKQLEDAQSWTDKRPMVKQSKMVSL